MLLAAIEQLHEPAHLPQTERAAEMEPNNSAAKEVLPE